MKRSVQREKAMIAVYQYLLAERDIDELAADVFEDTKPEDYFVEVMHTSVRNVERYSGYIDKVLTGWTFSRLGTIEKAILLNGCSEFDLKKTDAAVIINESVDLAKKYCEPESYKLINSVLDII